MDLQMIRLELVDPDPDQPRREMDEIQELAQSIKDKRLLQPPIVYREGGRYRLVDGHRRHAASRLLGKSDIHAIVLANKPDAARLLETQLTANCLRKDLTPMEKARSIKRLMEIHRWSNEEVAKALHMSKASVTQCLSFLSLSSDVQGELDSGKIAPSTAYAIARAPDETTKQALLEGARNGTLKRDDAAEAVRRRGATEGKVNRVACRLPGKLITVTCQGRLGLSELEEILQHLLRESRRAIKQGLDVVTFERVLADQSRQLNL